MKGFRKLVAENKIGELLEKEEKKVDKKKKVITILAIIGAIVAIAGIAYAIYRFCSKNYLKDFEDDFEDEESLLVRFYIFIIVIWVFGIGGA